MKHKAFSATKKNSSKPPYLFLGLGVLGIGVVGFLGYRYWKGKQQLIPIVIKQSNPSSKPSSKSKLLKRTWTDDAFPLLFTIATNTGSSGPRVLQLQQKLNLKHNVGLVADGKFGPLTRNILLSNGYPASVNLETFNKIVDSEATVVFDPKKIATLLWTSANAGIISSTLNALSQLKDTADYQSVSTIFKTFRDSSDYFRSHTLVTHLLDFAFKENDAVKAQLKKEFIRIGLKEKSGQWSLSGVIKPLRLLTLRDTNVRASNGKIVKVKKNTILGILKYTTHGFTWFQAIDGSTAAVASHQVKYVN